jgi:hypothetical protein
MSEEKINLEWLGNRVMMLTAEVRDLQLRFSALEGRFAAMESRFGAMETRLGAIERRFHAQEERMSAMLALIVRIAKRLDGGRVARNEAVSKIRVCGRPGIVWLGDREQPIQNAAFRGAGA